MIERVFFHMCGTIGTILFFIGSGLVLLGPLYVGLALILYYEVSAGWAAVSLIGGMILWLSFLMAILDL